MTKAIFGEREETGLHKIPLPPPTATVPQSRTKFARRNSKGIICIVESVPIGA